jgi:hemerythrin
MELLWNPSWETGVFLIDKQHKLMFKRATELLAAIKSQKEVQADVLIEFLHEYVEVHFSTEENYMLDIRYPAYSTHKEAHKILKQQTQTFSKPTVTEEVFNFIVTWLIDHINTHDRALANFIRHHGPKSSLGPTGAD